MQGISEEILMQASKGDTQAFEAIYRQTADFVYTVAFRVTNSKEDAEDVTQEVFFKIYKHLKNFQFRSSFKTWVYRITVNTAINASKKISKQLDRRADYEKVIESKASSDLTEKIIDRESSEALLESLLDILNPDQKACLVLREIEGLSYEEIAQTLGININTVRSRIKRAREALLIHSQKRGEKR